MSIPTWMALHVQREGRKRVRLWIPLILIWILLLPLLLLAAPFALLAAVITWKRGPGFSLLRFFPLLFGVIWNLPGLHVEVENPRERILIHIK